MKYVDPHYSCRILSYEPLVTLSGCQTDMVFIARMAEDLPEIFDAKKGLHILLPTWNVEGTLASQMKESIERASSKMPGHKFLVLSSTEYETYLLGLQAVPALLAHQGIFLDENIWKPSEHKLENLGTFDAVYNARFDGMKRHDLAQRIDSLLLIYGYSLDEEVEASTKKMKDLLPNAYFSNAERGSGKYSSLSSQEIVQLYGHARVGLCLSREEGYSRVSIEYMMCGLPIVSTTSIGGRDRYYSNDYCKIVDDDENAVAHAVRELVDRNYSAQEVRNKLLGTLEFERSNFLRSVNRIVEDHTGLRDFFPSIIPFIGIKQKFLPHTELLRIIKEELVRRPPGRTPVRHSVDTDSRARTPLPEAAELPRDEVLEVAVSAPMRHSSMEYPPLSANLAKSLDTWKAGNIRPKLFVRDDDAESDNPSLRNLVSLSEWLSVPILLSTIPEHCEKSLGQVVGTSGLITGAVHGYSHNNYAPAGSENCELCRDRPIDEILEQLTAGRSILLDIFDGRISNLLVPPWNNIDDEIAERALDIGFQGISSHGWLRMSEAIPRINTHVDLVNWRAGCTVLSHPEIDEQISHQLDTALQLGFQFVGIVTHHRHFNVDDWKTFANIIRALSAQGVEWIAADQLLPPKPETLMARLRAALK